MHSNHLTSTTSTSTARSTPNDEKSDLIYFPTSEYKKDHWALQYPKISDENFIAIISIDTMLMHIKLNATDARGYRTIVTIVAEDMASTLNRPYTQTEKRALQQSLGLVAEAFENAGCPIVQQQIAGNNSQTLTAEKKIQIGNAKEPNMLHGHIIVRGNPQKAYIGNVILNGPEPNVMFNMRGDGIEEGNKAKLKWKPNEMNVVATKILEKLESLIKSLTTVKIILKKQTTSAILVNSQAPTQNSAALSSSSTLDLKKSMTTPLSFKYKTFVTGMGVVPSSYRSNGEHIIRELLSSSIVTDGYDSGPEIDDSKLEAHSTSVAGLMSIGDTSFQKFKYAVKNEFADEYEELFENKLNPYFNSTTYQMKATSTGKSLRPSEIIKLANSFCASHSLQTSIAFCKDEKQKETAFYALFSKLLSTDEIYKLHNTTETIETAATKAIHHNKKPSISIFNLDKKSVLKNLTHHSLLPFKFFHPALAEQSQYNFDFFAIEAREAYKIGHQVACHTAAESKSKNDPSLLMKAIMMELFACNYLLNLFNAGHIRTPRKAIYDYLITNKLYSNTNTALTAAGLLAKEMHDEDYQLSITTDQKSCNHSKIDRCYHDDITGGQYENATLAISTGLKNIFYHYQVEGKDEISFDALNYLPRFPKIKGNPLFSTTGELRKEINNPDCKEYINKWNPADVLIGRIIARKSEDGKPAIPSNVQLAIRDEILQIVNEEPFIQCKVM